ncbi:MAG: UvrD-helicase domain-containing protein [Rhodocyclaceae bacterium]|nr:UvrD-helicase domain-containing protein [Rhodocyclaceae bacterium]
MKGLNPPQCEAVRYVAGPLLVLAGAGSGKTRVIAEKIAYLVETQRVAPRQLVAITFTNKAAHEMRERVERRLGAAAQDMFIGTFHALGAAFLRQEAFAAGMRPSFSILDAHDSLALFSELLRDNDKVKLRRVQAHISRWKNALIEPHEVIPRDDEEVYAASAFARYEQALRAYHAVDFDDLIRLPALLLSKDELLAARWQARIRHLLIDEYQDTNRCQNHLLRLLVGREACFTAVGDDDQSIYAWRGAEIDNIRRLAEDYPHLHVVKLEQNYRSSGRILAAANALIRHNPKIYDKKLWSEKGEGAPVLVKACEDEAHEAEWVVRKLLAHKYGYRGRFSDYAILYRSNYQARVFEQALRAQRVPYRLFGGQSFFEKSEIKDIMAYLRLLSNENDDPAFIRAATTPRRGIGANTLEALARAASLRHLALLPTVARATVGEEAPAAGWAALREFGAFIRRFADECRRVPAGEAYERLLSAIGYRQWLQQTHERREAETRLAHLDAFGHWLAEKGEEEGKNLLELAQSIALASMLEPHGKESDAVCLATLHAAKGLEFPHVFLVGVEEGVLPHRESIDSGMIEEERRLMYVGITRARESLTVSWRRNRRQGKERVAQEPSRFIAEMGLAPESEGAEVASREKASAHIAALRAVLRKSPPGALA